MQVALRRLWLLFLVSSVASACPYSALSATYWFNALKRQIFQRSASAPIPPLLAATGNADAHFLVQKKYGYTLDAKFVEPMGKAIQDASDKIGVALAEGHPITEAQVFEWMDGIAKVRGAIATEKGEERYGTPHPRTEVELERDGRGKIRAYYTTDYISKDPNRDAFRHAPYFDRANEVAKQGVAARKRNQENTTLEAFGETFPKSVILAFGAEVLVIHPTFEKSLPGLNRAVTELAVVLSDKTISETEFMDRAAEAYALLMHATPYERGTPSIVESFLDSALRAKFGKTLGQKTEEPFWEVHLRNPKQSPFRGPDLLRCFGGG